MKVKVKRFKEGRFEVSEFEVPVEGRPTLLEVLTKIKETQDPTLSFRVMCRASICGTCGVKLNGKPVLACNTRVEGEEIIVEPLDFFEPIKDLVVSHDPIYESLKAKKVWLIPKEEKAGVSAQDLLKTSKSWDCILCGLCNSVCPPLLEKKPFGGPSLFTKLYKSLEDPRNGSEEVLLKSSLESDPKACVHCSSCNIVCPKGCMPERWITLIETKLLQRGLIKKEEPQDFGFLGF